MWGVVVVFVLFLFGGLGGVFVFVLFCLGAAIFVVFVCCFFVFVVLCLTSPFNYKIIFACQVME